MIAPSRRSARGRPYTRHAGRLDMLRLDMMENPYGPAPSALKKLRGINPVSVSAYPEYERLLAKLASHLKVPADSIVVGDGSDEIIQAIFDAFCDEGDAAVIPQPTFPLFNIAAERVGARIPRVEYGPGFVFPKERFGAALRRRPRIAVIVTPNNPTGTSVDRAFVLRAVNEFSQVLFVVDEAYTEFGGEEGLATEAPRLGNLIVLRTFSKAYGLAGMRCGYAVASRGVLEAVERVRAPYPVSVATVAAAEAALGDVSWLRRTVRSMRAGRAFLAKRISLLGVRCIEGEANFVVAAFAGKAAAVAAVLKSRGILVKNLTGTHRLLKGMVRISVGKPADNRRLVKELARILKIMEI